MEAQSAVAAKEHGDTHGSLIARDEFILYMPCRAGYYTSMPQPTSSMRYLLYLMRHPASAIAVIYLVVCLAIWADNCWASSGMVGVMFGMLCTGGVNALLIVLASACRDVRTLPMGAALTFCSLMLFAFLPLIFLLIKQLPTDAQAAVAIPFYGGAATVLHLMVSLVLCGGVHWFSRSTKKNS